MTTNICRICGLYLTRANANQHDCPFCGRNFRRIDATKRHTRTCASRGSRALPPDVKRGRKSHACDKCAQVKVSCDSKTPCSRCKARALSCTYQRFCSDASHLTFSPTAEVLSKQAPAVHTSLRFLLACTDPNVEPVDSLILAREYDRDADSSESQEYMDGQNTIGGTIDPNHLFLSFLDPQFTSYLEETGTDTDYGTFGDDPRLQEDDDLQTQVNLLQNQLSSIAETEQRLRGFVASRSWEVFFTVSSFRDCIKIFFNRAQLLATILHRPTFHTRTIQSSLLLAVIVSGYAYQQYRYRNSEAALFAVSLREMAERLIFDHVKQLLDAPNGSQAPKTVLEVCQAAYIIETLWSCVKDANVRRRIMTRCHPMLVNLLRGSGMTGTSHDARSAEDWYAFIHKESAIRLMHWTFINDAWFTLFTNHPPAMTIADMSGQLPCDDRLWNAESAIEYQDIVTQRTLKLSSLSLQGLVRRLLANKSVNTMGVPLPELEINYFLVLIFALHHVIFHYHTSSLIEDGTSVLLIALDRWDSLWDHAMQRIDDDRRNTLGLVKYSSELAYLLRRIVERSQAENDDLPIYLRRVVNYDTMPLHQFIRQCAL